MDRVLVKRIYELAVRSDGFRVLVDRLWPRGISKERAALDLWMKDRALDQFAAGSATIPSDGDDLRHGTARSCLSTDQSLLYCARAHAKKNADASVWSAERRAERSRGAQRSPDRNR